MRYAIWLVDREGNDVWDLNENTLFEAIVVARGLSFSLRYNKEVVLWDRCLSKRIHTIKEIGWENPLTTS